jgi:hypothetical protein
MTATANHAAASALAAVEQLLAERPDRVAQDFSQATRCLSAYRDALIGIWRQTGAAADRHRLGRVNAVLSVIVGGNYPLGEIPWPLIEKARAELADLTPRT